MGAPEGLRDRKKRRTRQQIHRAAMDLFRERGYPATTIDDIAVRAEVARRTFFAYFPSKEDLVWLPLHEAVAALTRDLEDRGPGESALTVLRAWLLGLRDDPFFDREFQRWVEDLESRAPEVAVGGLKVLASLQAVVARSLALDLGLDREDVRPRMAAAAVLAALQSLTGDEPGAVADVDTAFAFARGGLAAVHPAPPPGDGGPPAGPS